MKSNEQGAARPRVLIVGCGGIGGVLAGTLQERASGQLGELTALSSNEAIARAVNDRGYALRGVDGERVVRGGRVVTEVPRDAAPYDWVLLATQPPQVEEAARRALPHLAPGGAMVCLQNGLCEARVAPIAGDERVLGAVLAWGAAMREPGVYERTSRGGFTVGRPDGREDPRSEALARVLGFVGPARVTRNLAGARWSKLAINCAISTLGTIGGDRLGPLMLRRVVRRLALEIMTEVVAVARREGVVLEKVSGTLDLEWIALREREKLGARAAKHGVLLAVGAKYRNLRSSMLSAIERGRPPAVDFLNGEVVTRGRAYGLATPFNAAAQELVHAIARGEKRSSMEALRSLGRELGVG